MEDLQQFLQEEELVPVIFTTKLEGCGFLVSKEDATADIPEGYKAGLPFWIAQELAKVNFVTLEEPRWLSDLGPGATITAQRRYSFAKDIEFSRKDIPGLQRLYYLIQSRASQLINDALKNRKYIPGHVETMYMAEESDMIDKTHRNHNLFLQWKKKTAN